MRPGGDENAVREMEEEAGGESTQAREHARSGIGEGGRVRSGGDAASVAAGIAGVGLLPIGQTDRGRVSALRQTLTTRTGHALMTVWLSPSLSGPSTVGSCLPS